MPAAIFTADEQKLILKDYAVTGKMKKTASNFGTTIDVVRYCLKKHGVTIIPQKSLSDSEIDEVVELYQEGFRFKDIGKRLGFGGKSIKNALEKRGIGLRCRTDSYKKYNIDREYFRHIDTPLKAYWLGLMYADGNLSKDTFSITLQDGDEYLLEYLQKELKHDGPLNYHGQDANRKKAVRFYVTDIPFAKILRTQGMFDRKTSSVRFPFDILKKEYYWSFLLGLGDGDGCVMCKHYGKRFNYLYQFAGSEGMMKDVKKITDELGIPSVYEGPIYTRGCKLVFNTVNGIRVMNEMYKQRLEIFMTRKFNKYKNIINHIMEPSRRKAKKTVESAIKAQQIIAQYN